MTPERIDHEVMLFWFPFWFPFGQLPLQVDAQRCRWADPRQDRGVKAKSHVDGRPANARLRRHGPEAGDQRVPQIFEDVRFEASGY
jgi:hypothetical protein